MNKPTKKRVGLVSVGPPARGIVLLFLVTGRDIESQYILFDIE